MPTWWFVVLCVLIVVLLGAWRLTYTAARLDRLHVRVEGSIASLDAQLVRRADAASELAASGCLDPASSMLLVSAAAASLERAEEALVADEVRENGLPHPRIEVESELTAVLNAVVAEWEPNTNESRDLHRRMADACVRVELAQRFHNEAVRDVRRVRSKRVVRVFHLAGTTVLPSPVELDAHVSALESLEASWEARGR